MQKDEEEEEDPDSKESMYVCNMDDELRESEASREADVISAVALVMLKYILLLEVDRIRRFSCCLVLMNFPLL